MTTTAAPPAVARRPLARRVTGPVAVAAGLAVATTALALRDPHVPGSWGGCPFLMLTGVPCPVCGGLRAVNDLTRGDLVAALSSNAFVVLAIPVAAAVWAVWLARRVRGRGDEWPPLARPAVAWALVAALLVFGVVRVATPWGAVLAP